MNKYKNMLVGKGFPFAIEEAFKEIRTNMLYTARDVKCPIYALTSGLAHEGKSIVAANLASSFAKLGKRVLLLDADLRNPTLHHIFSCDRSLGVSEIAAGICKEPLSAVLHTEIEGLDLIPAGHIPPNPAELLATTAFEEFLKSMQDCYDAIFIDFPPVGVVVDALIPAELITGYAVVVYAGLADRHAVSETLTSMKAVDAKVLGFILNGIDPKEGGYSRRDRKYRYKYSYKYGFYPGASASQDKMINDSQS